MIKRPLGLYRRAAETRPEVNDAWLKPIGADAKVVKIGPGLPEKQTVTNFAYTPSKVAVGLSQTPR